MRVYQTLATHRLEDKANELGYQIDVRVIEPHEDARYFVTAIKSVAVKHPSPLGWTDEESIETLRRGSWKHGRIIDF